MSLSLARKAIDLMKQLGVRQAVVCAGARNAPLVKELNEECGIEIFRFFEEREAGFFAIGLLRAYSDSVKENGAPVAVVTTSGTAAAELLPAMIEAHYQCLPLIAVTADRPPSYRGSGAPQAIEHLGLYSNYAEAAIDWTEESQPLVASYSFRAPLHLNICFDEPLLREGRAMEQALGLVERAKPLSPLAEKLHLAEKLLLNLKKPLVLLAPMNARDQALVKQLIPSDLSVFAEALSGFKSQFSKLNFLTDSFLRQGLREGLWDGVLRIGDVPTHRLWRDLETLNVPVLNFSSKPWRGLSDSQLEVWPLEVLSHLNLKELSDPVDDQWVETKRAKNLQVIQEHPLSEIGWLRSMSQRLFPSDMIYLGNSLPVREFEWAELSSSSVHGNRGANGIDGQISTFLGMARPQSRHFGFFGDLTTLYGLSSLWGYRQRPLQHLQIVVINNGGGQIFDDLFGDSRFLNSHQLQFKPWAEFWGFHYQCPSSPADWDPDLSPAVIEVVPDPEQSSQLRKVLAQ